MSGWSATGEWPTASGPTGELPTVPGYEVLAELGRGGMGVVYRARHLASDRLVALKLLRDGALAGAQDVARFRIEAEAGARMQHPNIVPIHEVGEHQGRPFFVMELVQGGSLDKILVGQPQPPRHAAALLRTLALAIQHAHDHRIVHRDLKPANVLLAVASEQLPVASEAGTWRTPSLTTSNWQLTFTPKIADFGLAKRLDHENTVLTQTGAVLGTASYMAPEQAGSNNAAIGPTTDVYALGAILYELLAGRPPFVGESWNKTIEQVLHEEPIPFDVELPRDLETICFQCLEKDPGKRYASAQGLADDLGRYLDGQPVAAVPVDQEDRLRRVALRDGYDLLEVIGNGPRSVVHRAQFGPLKQLVAVKVFTSGAWTRDSWETWLRQGAATWGALTHPQVVLPQRSGWWQGRAYLVSEFLPQGSLVDQLGGQPLSLHDAVLLVEHVADVISYLHRQGVVHGNLKPSNVLLAADGVPRLVDLHWTGGHFVPTAALVSSSQDAMAWLAPEYLQTPPAEPRPYADTYGLGVLLYGLLTGRAPFHAATSEELLEQVRSAVPDPPSKHDSKVPEALDHLCKWCLKKNPWRRPTRAFDVQRALRHWREAPESRS